MRMRKGIAIMAASAMMLMGTLPQTALTVCAEEAQQTTATTMYATANVNVRAGDCATAKRLGTLTKGQAVASTGKTEKGWYIVDYNGQTGYVSGKYLTEDSALSTPSQPTEATAQANNAAATTGGTKTFSNGVTFVQCGTTPNGLNIWCLDGDTGSWSDDMITAYDATGITNDMSDYDKAVAINNYICKVVDYDWDFYNGVVKSKPASECGRHCVTSGRGICQDYAEAFDCLCTMAGVYSNVVYGTGTDVATGTSGDHAWNYVLIGDIKYWVDSCWNDYDGKPNAYLMSTTLWSDHTYEGEYTSPS